MIVLPAEVYPTRGSRGAEPGSVEPAYHTDMDRLVGGLEAGGSKFVCAVGTGPDDIRAETRFATTTPEATIGRAVAFFTEQAAGAPLAALGIASFGPLDLDPRSPTFGVITTTPKPGWRQVDLAGPLRRALGLPVAIDTDVNGAALAEHRWGSGRGVASLVYVTVGSGIGGGALVHGRPVHGLVHPEMGHLRVPHDPVRDPFPGACPHHGDCLEGLASAPALAARWRQAPETLPEDHPAWELQAHYLALGLANVILVLSPERVVIGGGVMARARLYPLIRAKLASLLGGYLQTPALGEGIDDYVVPPALADRAGVLGAIALSQAAVS
jgi:fructokinase